MEDIFDKLGIQDEATKMNTFVQGLKPEVRAKLMLMKPTSFFEAEESCLLLEITHFVGLNVRFELKLTED